MSSWRSHLPAGLGEVTGLGMNEAEMQDNPQLDSFVVHDLNRSPILVFEDASFDAVLCAVSVQYLTRPFEVFADCRRVLREDGICIVSFSNRCFPTKAVRVWLSTTDNGHRILVRRYLERSGFRDVADEELSTPDDPLFVVYGRR
jgi:ubiquinone/menaquinone biosynthesis C-methylase UbiE